MACDDVLVAVGQENALPWIEKDLGIEFDRWEMPKVNSTTMQSTYPKVFFGGDSAFGPKNIIWAVAHGHEAAVSIDLLCSGDNVQRIAPPPAEGQSLCRHEDGDLYGDGATTTISRWTNATRSRTRRRK